MRARDFLAGLCLAILLVLFPQSPAQSEESKPAAVKAAKVSIGVEVELAAEEGAEAGGEACESEACDSEACDSEACETDAEGQVAAVAPAENDAEVVYPTHHQTKVIEVNVGDLPRTRLQSFCLSPDGTVMAACSGEQGEVRLFSPDGEYQSSWTLSVQPEAINVGSDGGVYVAGGGKLMRLGSDGQVLHEADAPHIEDSAEKREEVRKQLLERQQRSVATYEKMSARYDERLAKLLEKRKAMKEGEEEIPESLDRQINNAERMVEQWKSIVAQLGGAELSEEDIEKRVTAALKSASAVASISESGGEVFIAAREAAGYGFCVWKMDRQFAGGEVITKGLSGCCGQMDVQCCENGLYVAENSRHRVYHLSSTGEELGEWGHGARDGLEGFGSCCNPMNVAFGPDRTVYTAESGTGRIKRYTPEGKLIELVGKVDIVPGCKKVSIAVDQSGDRVYMLDITRHHIVLMQRVPEGETPGYSEYRTADRRLASGVLFDDSDSGSDEFTIEVSTEESSEE